MYFVYAQVPGEEAQCVWAEYSTERAAEYAQELEGRGYLAWVEEEKGGG